MYDHVYVRIRRRLFMRGAGSCEFFSANARPHVLVYTVPIQMQPRAVTTYHTGTCLGKIPEGFPSFSNRDAVPLWLVL